MLMSQIKSIFGKIIADPYTLQFMFDHYCQLFPLLTVGCGLMLVSSLLRAMMVSSSSRILVSFSDSASGSPLMLTRDGVLNIIVGEVFSGERDREADMVLSPAPGPSSA